MPAGFGVLLTLSRTNRQGSSSSLFWPARVPTHVQLSRRGASDSARDGAPFTWTTPDFCLWNRLPGEEKRGPLLNLKTEDNESRMVREWSRRRFRANVNGWRRNLGEKGVESVAAIPGYFEMVYIVDLMHFLQVCLHQRH